MIQRQQEITLRPCMELYDIPIPEDNDLRQINDLIDFSFVLDELNCLSETIEDELEYLKLSKDADAKVGHKSAETSFFWYKTHIAMTVERIITSPVITSGEKSDGKQLQELIEKSKRAGIDVNTVGGDGANSGKENIGYAGENEINLVSKLPPKIYFFWKLRAV